MQMAWRIFGSVRRTDKTAPCFIFSTGALYASTAYRAVLPSFFISPPNRPTPGAVCLFHRPATGKASLCFPQGQLLLNWPWMICPQRSCWVTSCASQVNVIPLQNKVMDHFPSFLEY